MPETAQLTIPEDVRDVFDEPALGHTSWLNERGQIVTFPLWVDFDGEHVKVSTWIGAKKSETLRKSNQVAVEIVSARDPWHWVSISGRVTDIRPDENLEFIDKMSRKYIGQDYQRRTPREVFYITIDRVSSSRGGG